tara:strand:+ start:1340 stop:1924 length:585 start_codon:yes stop_codon:yes gene_type:complete
MKTDLKLRFETPKEWIDTVLADFNSFLQDHADCERKASSMAMSFVAKCPDKIKIIPELIETALEELVHFKLVYEIMETRGVPLKSEMEKDFYINDLMKTIRSSSNERLLDRMVLASIIEMRGAERFKMIADNIEDEELSKFYTMLYLSEAKHGDVFKELASHYWPVEEIDIRMDNLLDREAEICSKLKFRAALH